MLPAPLDHATLFGLWLNLPRVWERQAALVLRGVSFAHSGGDPGELLYEATELVEGKGKERRWEATKARALAEGMKKWLG